MDPCFPSSWDGTGRDGMGDLLDGTAHGGQLPAGWPPTYPYPYPYPYRLRLFVSSFSFLKHNTGPGQDQGRTSASVDRSIRRSVNTWKVKLGKMGLIRRRRTVGQVRDLHERSGDAKGSPHPQLYQPKLKRVTGGHRSRQLCAVTLSMRPLSLPRKTTSPVVGGVRRSYAVPLPLGRV